MHASVRTAALDADGNDTSIDVPVERNGRYVMIVEAVGFPDVCSGFRDGTRDGTREDGWIKDLFGDGRIDNESGEIISDGETVVKIE